MKKQLSSKSQQRAMKKKNPVINPQLHPAAMNQGLTAPEQSFKAAVNKLKNLFDQKILSQQQKKKQSRASSRANDADDSKKKIPRNHRKEQEGLNFDNHSKKAKKKTHTAKSSRQKAKGISQLFSQMEQKLQNFKLKSGKSQFKTNHDRSVSFNSFLGEECQNISIESPPRFFETIEMRKKSGDFKKLKDYEKNKFTISKQSSVKKPSKEKRLIKTPNSGKMKTEPDLTAQRRLEESQLRKGSSKKQQKLAKSLASLNGASGLLSKSNKKRKQSKLDPKIRELKAESKKSETRRKVSQLVYFNKKKQNPSQNNHIKDKSKSKSKSKFEQKVSEGKKALKINSKNTIFAKKTPLEMLKTTANDKTHEMGIKRILFEDSQSKALEFYQNQMTTERVRYEATGPSRGSSSSLVVIYDFSPEKEQISRKEQIQSLTPKKTAPDLEIKQFRKALSRIVRTEEEKWQQLKQQLRSLIPVEKNQKPRNQKKLQELIGRVDAHCRNLREEFQTSKNFQFTDSKRSSKSSASRSDYIEMYKNEPFKILESSQQKGEGEDERPINVQSLSLQTSSKNLQKDLELMDYFLENSAHIRVREFSEEQGSGKDCNALQGDMPKSTDDYSKDAIKSPPKMSISEYLNRDSDLLIEKKIHSPCKEKNQPICTTKESIKSQQGDEDQMLLISPPPSTSFIASPKNDISHQEAKEFIKSGKPFMVLKDIDGYEEENSEEALSIEFNEPSEEQQNKLKLKKLISNLQWPQSGSILQDSALESLVVQFVIEIINQYTARKQLKQKTIVEMIFQANKKLIDGSGMGLQRFSQKESQENLIAKHLKSLFCSGYVEWFACEALKFCFDCSKGPEQLYAFNRNISKPHGVDTKVMLKFMRDSAKQNQLFNEMENGILQSVQQEDQTNNLEGQNEGLFDYLLDLETFMMFESTILQPGDKKVGGQNDIQQSENSQSVREARRFFHQAIFDLINSLLDQLRPFGSKGRPPICFDSQVCARNRQYQVQYLQKYLARRVSQEASNIRLGIVSFDGIPESRIPSLLEENMQKMSACVSQELEGDYSRLEQCCFEVSYELLAELQEQIINKEVFQLLKLQRKIDTHSFDIK